MTCILFYDSYFYGTISAVVHLVIYTDFVQNLLVVAPIVGIQLPVLLTVLHGIKACAKLGENWEHRSCSKVTSNSYRALLHALLTSAKFLIS